MLDFIINELFVDFVGEDQDVLAQGNFTKGFEFLPGVNGTGGVGRAVHDEHLGGRGHGVLEFIGGHLPTVFLLGVDDHGDGSGKADHVRVAGPVRGRDDHFVARAAGGKDGVVTGVFGPAVDADEVGRVAEAVVGLELGADGFAEFEQTGAGGVFGLAGSEGSHGGVLDVGRGVHVGFTSAEGADVDAFLLHFGGLGGDGERDGGSDFSNGGRDEVHEKCRRVGW